MLPITKDTLEYTKEMQQLDYLESEGEEIDNQHKLKLINSLIEKAKLHGFNQHYKIEELYLEPVVIVVRIYKTVDSYTYHNSTHSLAKHAENIMSSISLKQLVIHLNSILEV